jgi:hypothetical protein
MQVTNFCLATGFQHTNQGAVHMEKHLRRAIVLTLTITLCGLARAQSKSESAAKDETGFTSYMEFDGSSNSAGQAYELDSSVGYSFTRHFGMDLSLPLYFVNGSASGSTSGSGVGNPSVDLRWRYPNPSLNYATVLTGSAPLGDKTLGVNTGHATFDWTNHFDHSFNRVTPFAEAGFSNTTADARLFVRPYTSFGYNTHFRGGAEVDVWKIFSAGAAGYDIAPFGKQTLYSRVSPHAATAGPGAPGKGAGAAGGQAFNSSQRATGSAAIAKDYGYSTWMDANLNRYIDAELGYTRSAQLNLNTLSFSLGFNVGRLIRQGK